MHTKFLKLLNSCPQSDLSEIHGVYSDWLYDQGDARWQLLRWSSRIYLELEPTKKYSNKGRSLLRHYLKLETNWLSMINSVTAERWLALARTPLVYEEFST